MTKKEIINLLEQKHNYYNHLFTYYFNKYLNSNYKKNKKEYLKLSDEFHVIDIIITAILQQAKEK